MATFNKFQTLAADMPNKVHNLSSDQLKVALTNIAPVATNSVLANLTEVSYTNLSTRNITTTSSTQTAGLYKLILADLTITSTGGTTGPFRYVSVYNSTAAGGPLIGWSDYGTSTTIQDGDSFLIDFDNANGVFQLT